jgi:hypothetical protein
MRYQLLIGLVAAIACDGDAPPAPDGSITLIVSQAIGPADSGAASFNLIAGLAETPDGHLAVLDHQVQELRIFDTTGTFVRLAGRRGAGPAEFTQATGFAVDPVGRIWVFDPPIGRFTVFTSEGEREFDRTVTTGMWSVPWTGSIDSAGRVYDTAVRYLGADIIPVLRRFAPDLEAVDTLLHPTCRGDYSPPAVTHFSFKGGGVALPFLPAGRWIVDDRGAAWCASSDTDRLVQVDLVTGDTLLLISGPRKARPLTAGEKANALESVRSLFGHRPPPLTEADLPPVRPFIESLARDRSGRLWLQIRTEADESTTFDVIDPVSGRRVVAHLGARIEAGSPRFFTATHLLLVALAPDDVPYVVRVPLDPLRMAAPAGAR